MTGRLRELAERRERLVALAAAQRADLAAAAAAVQREVALFDGLLSVVRAVGRHPTLTGLAAGSLALLAPGTWRRSLTWFIGVGTMVLEVYRLTRALRRAAE